MKKRCDYLGALVTLVRGADATYSSCTPRLSERNLEMIAAARDRIEAIECVPVRRKIAHVMDGLIHALLRDPDFVLGKTNGGFSSRRAFAQLREDVYDLDGLITEWGARFFRQAAQEGDADLIAQLKASGFDINAHAKNRHRAPLAELVHLTSITEVPPEHFQTLVDQGAKVTRGLLNKVQHPVLRAALDRAWLRQAARPSRAPAARIARSGP